MSFPPLPSLPAVPPCERGLRTLAQRDRCGCPACATHRKVRDADLARVQAAQQAVVRWVPRSAQRPEARQHADGRRKHRAGRRKQALRAAAVRRKTVARALALRLWAVPTSARLAADPFTLRSALRRYVAHRKGKLRIVAVLRPGQIHAPPRGARTEGPIPAAEDFAAAGQQAATVFNRYSRNAAYRERASTKK